MAKQYPKENRLLLLRRLQWQTLRELKREHGCASGDIVGTLIEVHLKNFAPKLGTHLARLKSMKS